MACRWTLKNSMGETPLDLADHQERYREARCSARPPRIARLARSCGRYHHDGRHQEALGETARDAESRSGRAHPMIKDEECFRMMDQTRCEPQSVSAAAAGAAGAATMAARGRTPSRSSTLTCIFTTLPGRRARPIRQARIRRRSLPTQYREDGDASRHRRRHQSRSQPLG